jgi:arylsulfatase A-like enzyme
MTSQTRRNFIAGTAAGLGAAALNVPVYAKAKHPGKPVKQGDRLNFIIFQPDEMRAESLPSYGHPLTRTPHMDRIAAEGTVFNQCHVQNTVCTPSRCSFVTGRYVHVNGHRNLWYMLNSHERNLFRYLNEDGYEIRHYGKNDMFSPDHWDLAVDVARLRSWKGVDMQVNPWEYGDYPNYYSFLYNATGDRKNHKDYQQVDAALNYLRSNPEDPFCIFLPMAAPHPPYQAPDGFHDMYNPDDVPELRPRVREGKPRYHEGIIRTRHMGNASEELLRKINAVYLGMISYQDWALGELIRTLEETGMYDNTVILINSDHGDWAGDYGLVEKWPSALDDTLTRIPMIIRTPDGAKGHRVNEQIEMFDMMPTMLDLAGVECQHTHFAHSLVPQLEGAAGDPERVVYSEGGYDPHEPQCFETFGSVEVDKKAIYYPKIQLQVEDPASVCRATMIRTPDYKLIHRPNDVSELYDLRKDPQELNNLHNRSDVADVQRQLEGQMLDWYVHTSDLAPFEHHPRSTPDLGVV